VAVHTWNFNTQKVERSHIQGQPGPHRNPVPKAKHKKTSFMAGHQWLMPILLATQEAEIRRIAVQSQHRPYLEKPLHKKGWWSGLRQRPSQTSVLPKEKNPKTRMLSAFLSLLRMYKKAEKKLQTHKRVTNSPSLPVVRGFF
jgi:hypothetical protein